MNTKYSKLSLWVVFVTFAFSYVAPGQALDCKDNPDGFYPIAGDCAYFFECDNGVRKGWVCLADYFYNPNINKCEVPTVPWCTDYPKPVDCSQTYAQGRVPSRSHEDKCKTYIDCNTKKEETCPGSTLYNPETRGCDSPFSFTCREV